MSLDERRLDDPAFREALRQQFPASVSYWLQPMHRRRFLQLMGAALALAGLGSTGCIHTPAEDNVPSVRGGDVTEPVYYATAVRLSGVARGVLAKCSEGRPFKLEGNPDHPDSRGATDAITQAELLSLYDPERSRMITQNGQASTWPAFVQALRAAKNKVRILTDRTTSPTLIAQLHAFTQARPDARWHVWDALDDRSAFLASAQAFGRPADLVYRFDQARVVVSLDADFLRVTRYARDFASGRRVRDKAAMNRLYVVESGYTITGASADRRVALKPAEIARFASDLDRAVRQGADSVEGAAREAARDLLAARGACVVLAGPNLPPQVHALTHSVNKQLEAFGRTVSAVPRIDEQTTPSVESLAALVADMRAGEVETLVIIGSNPACTAPADLQFTEALTHVSTTMHVGLHADETARLCAWHVPLQHDLETWSDGRALDGTVTIVQPVISPLYGGRSPHEVLAVLNGEEGLSGREAVRRQHRLDERAWRESLQRGFIDGSAFAALDPLQMPDSPPPPPGNSGFELVFRPDPALHDGRYANNAWLQELPDPLTRMAWDNAFLISPATAAALRVKTGDVVDARAEGRAVRGPVYVLKGHADGCATVALGYGRQAAGDVGNGIGFDAYPLRTSEALAVVGNVELAPVPGAHHTLALVQRHDAQEDRDLLRLTTLARFLAAPPHQEPGLPSLYPDYDYTAHAAPDGAEANRYRWGMAIDLTACVGCSACVVACQAENNVPSVGREEVQREHAMHWLRVDRYFDGDEAAFQPVPCMHCENAPCELVCPVGATMHSDEGLNEMVYNRCVGTRYCSNNCPYKVRRFNWFDYASHDKPLLYNPDVTVRARGVMEKCTYCVQRIEHSRIRATQEDRTIREGEVVTACQQVCPTQAIVFGNLNDPASAVAQAAAHPLGYAMLAELNTRPRTRYLTRVTNPPETGS